MSIFKIDDEVWVDAVEGHFGRYLYTDTEVIKAKVMHVDAVYPAKMIVSHTRQTNAGVEMSVVDSRYVFHKRNDLLKHRASRKNIKIGDLVAAVYASYAKDNELQMGVVVKITKSYVHFQAESGICKRYHTQCVVISRQQENKDVKPV